jgi:hypothetical protein
LAKGNAGGAMVGGCKAIALGNRTAVAQWMAQCQSNFFVVGYCRNSFLVFVSNRNIFGLAKNWV